LFRVCCTAGNLIVFSPATDSDNVSQDAVAVSTDDAQSPLLLDDEVRLIGLLFLGITYSKPFNALTLLVEWQVRASGL